MVLEYAIEQLLKTGDPRDKKLAQELHNAKIARGGDLPWPAAIAKGCLGPEEETSPRSAPANANLSQPLTIITDANSFLVRSGAEINRLGLLEKLADLTAPYYSLFELLQVQYTGKRGTRLLEYGKYSLWRKWRKSPLIEDCIYCTYAPLGHPLGLHYDYIVRYQGRRGNNLSVNDAIVSVAGNYDPDNRGGHLSLDLEIKFKKPGIQQVSLSWYDSYWLEQLQLRATIDKFLKQLNLNLIPDPSLFTEFFKEGIDRGGRYLTLTIDDIPSLAVGIRRSGDRFAYFRYDPDSNLFRWQRQTMTNQQFVDILMGLLQIIPTYTGD